MNPFNNRSFIVALFIISLSFPSILSVQSLNAQDRPFWTEKSCYLEFGVVYGIGVSLRKHSLEEARKAAFNAGVWEIANFAQIIDTTLLFIETQMTYEEQNKDETYSVWRLVKTPIEMLQNTKKALGSNKPIYQKLATKIKQLEDENQKEKADNLRRAVGMGKSVDELKRELQALTARVAKVEEKVEDIDKQVAALSQLYKELKYKKDNIEKVGEAEINWTKKLIRVKGYGAPNKDFPAHVQKLSAQEAARVDAQAKLIEIAKELKINSRTFVKNFQVQSDEKIREVQGKIKGAYQIGETRYLSDGTAEMIMEVNVDDVF